MSTPLWTSDEAARATGGRNTQDWAATGVSIDTRTIEAGDLFVALADVRDGHDFVAQALDKGAAAALVSRVPEGVAPDAPLLIVPDVLKALEEMARHARARTNARVIAVTGSVGKTTCKEMLRTVLYGNVHASVASYNNHWGVPLTLARMPADTEYAVIEIGMNHMGEIAPLSQMARPHVGVVTTVAEAHVEGFAEHADLGAPRSLIAMEKAQIFAGLEQGGTAVLGAALADTVILMSAATTKGAQIIDAGPQAGNLPDGIPAVTDAIQAMRDKMIVSEGMHPEMDSFVTSLNWNGAARTMTLGSPQEHHHFNMRLALASAEAAGAQWERLQENAKAWTPAAGRGALHHWSTPTAQGILIDESYNANPTSMIAALKALASYKKSHHPIAILGDMKELGPHSAAAHAQLAQVIATLFDDEITVWTLGDMMRHLGADLSPRIWRSFDSIDAITTAILEEIEGTHALMIKGSNSMGLARVVQAVTSGNT